MPRRTLAGPSLPARVLPLFCGALISSAPTLLAAQSESGNGGPGNNWWLYTVALMGVVLTALNIIDKLTPKPPLHRQYAAVDHRHEEYVTQQHFHAVRAKCDAERHQDREASERIDQRLFDKLDGVRESLAGELHGMERRIGDRITPLSDAISANKQAINSHLSDHRAGKV